MSRNSSGTYSLPAGNPVVSGTTISSTWANGTLSDVGTEITNSLDRGGRGAMTAPLQHASGNISAPSITFSADSAAGLYRAASQDIRMAVAATDLQKWTASGTSFPAGASFPTGLTSAGGVTLTDTSVSTTAVQNVLMAPSIPKAWATIKTNGSGSVSVTDGFGIASVSLPSGATVRVTFAQAFANANYAMSGAGVGFTAPFTVGGSGSANKSVTVCDVGLWSLGSGAQITNMNSSINEFFIVFFGRQ